MTISLATQTSSATPSGVSFAERWRELAAERSPLCLGVAPSDKWLATWQLPEGVAGARRYCEVLLEATGESLAVVKVQVPFFTRFGEAGMRLLRWFVQRNHDAGTLVLLDAKLGDADDTMRAYGELYLGPASVLGGDAVTVHCYMGFASVGPLLHWALASGTGVLIVARTSNHAADEVQLARQQGQPTSALLADLVTSWNAEHAAGLPVGPVGAVVGARSPESAELYGRLPRSLVEVPGLGRPDRSSDEVVSAASVLVGRALFTVTTGVLRYGPDAAALRSGLAHWSGQVTRSEH